MDLINKGRMECLICFEPFESDIAYIPDLNCSCVFIVHTNCWIKWGKGCMYHRQVDPEPEPEPEPPRETNQTSIIRCYIYFFLILTISQFVKFLFI